MVENELGIGANVNGIFSRLKKDPFGSIKRAIFKTVIGPIRYGMAGDYDAARYWHDRFTKYGRSWKGPGDEGLSEEENKRMYEEAAKVFIDACKSQNVNFEKARVLEIGCGSGFYTQLLHELGVKSYVGIDITDVFFPELRKKFPRFDFVRQDITEEKAIGIFDLIVMIDVIEHIVNDSRVDFAMENIKSCLTTNGVIIIGPVMESREKRFFYLKFWSLKDIKQRFPEHIFGELEPFRNGHILTIRKP